MNAVVRLLRRHPGMPFDMDQLHRALGGERYPLRVRLDYAVASGHVRCYSLHGRLVWESAR